MRSNIAPGGARPDYELPDHAQTIRKLSELQADDPWCAEHVLVPGHRVCSRPCAAVSESPHPPCGDGVPHVNPDQLPLPVIPEQLMDEPAMDDAMPGSHEHASAPCPAR